MANKEYKIDVVFVIDATGSMEPIMDEVKQNALTLGDKIVEALHNDGKGVKSLRLRVIDFADFASEGEDAIRATDFFEMPIEKDRFEQAINDIDIYSRGGDIPENGLEALYVAMCSDWVHIARGEKGRHIIVLLTDAVPLHLGERDGWDGYYKDDYPENLDELTNIWHENDDEKTTILSSRDKRLVLFAPDGCDEMGHSWEPVIDWEYTIATHVDSATGLKDIDLTMIIRDIVRSV